MTSLRRIAAAAALAALLVPGAAAAGDKDDSRLFVLADGDQEVTVQVEAGEMTITTEDADGTTVRVVDLEQVGRLVRDSLQDVFATLGDMQIDTHAGRDNRLEFSTGDETVEIDLDAIMAEVGAALEGGLAGLDRLETTDWSSVRARDRADEELRRELRELKREVRRLQRELEKREI